MGEYIQRIFAHSKNAESDGEEEEEEEEEESMVWIVGMTMHGYAARIESAYPTLAAAVRDDEGR